MLWIIAKQPFFEKSRQVELQSRWVDPFFSVTAQKSWSGYLDSSLETARLAKWQ
jgi:hypothetical protein